ncbi:MAG TPA: glutathione synthase [Actinomycetota bacterium]|nr:glutathione synthase [Actinomycetota bacterium]
MRLVLFVNDVATEVDEYTTTRLAVAASRLEHEVFYVGAGDVRYRSGDTIRARAHVARHSEGDDLTSFLERVQEEDSEQVIDLAEADVVFLRNDSIEDLHERPWAFNSGSDFGMMLVARGVTVLNDPEGLTRASSKLYLEEFPERIRPRSLVSRDLDEIKAFVEETGPSVLKPLYGAKGRNVFIIDDGEDPNLAQMIEAVLEDGYVLAQERVEGAEDGDLRLFLLDGEPLRSAGAYAAFRRIPRGGDPRANISAGGKPVEAEIGKRELAVVDAMSERLRRDGMFFVGLDMIGDKVVEINAESPGGLQAVEHFTGVDFAPIVIEALERKVGASPGRLRSIG